MTRPRLLDLFCCAGGAAMGYHRAGFDVVGVDINPQPHYPFEFHQGDANEWPLDGFDAVHASPPCQDHSSLKTMHDGHGTGWMLEHTRKRLQASGLPYIIENVPGADMPGALTLCGTEFGLRSGDRWLRRHRLFEASFDLWGAGGCHCAGKKIGGVYGTGGEWLNGKHGVKLGTERAREAMGTPWMNRAEVSQAIPPAYTEHIGAQLLTHIETARAA